MIFLYIFLLHFAAENEIIQFSMLLSIINSKMTVYTTMQFCCVQFLLYDDERKWQSCVQQTKNRYFYSHNTTEKARG